MTDKKEKSEDMKTYLIECDDETKRKITVPSHWKVTFGPAVVGNNGKPGGLKMPMALRFYENKEQQRAIFTDVKSFRDMSIVIEEEKTTVQQKTGYMDVEGTKKSVNLQAETTEWINPDEPQEPPTKLISDFGDDIEL